MDWVRLWHDMPNDPKWRTISRVSKQPISMVISVYIHMLISASNATERGRTQGLFDEDIAAALDANAEDVAAIRGAMQGRVIDGDRLTGWERRQPQREDNSAVRAKVWRESKKAERNRTQPNAEERPDTDTDTDKKNLKPSSASSEKRSTAVAASDAWFGKEFWPLWPVARNRKAAMVAARKVKPEDRQKVVAGVKTQSARIAAMERPIHAATWINGARWEDAPDQGLFATQGVELWPGQLGGRPHPDAIIRNFKKGDFIR